MKKMFMRLLILVGIGAGLSIEASNSQSFLQFVHQECIRDGKIKKGVQPDWINLTCYSEWQKYFTEKARSFYANNHPGQGPVLVTSPDGQSRWLPKIRTSFEYLLTHNKLILPSSGWLMDSSLNFAGYCLSDMKGFDAYCKKNQEISSVDLSYNYIEDINFLADFPNLKTVKLDNNPIYKVPHLKDCKSEVLKQEIRKNLRKFIYEAVTKDGAIKEIEALLEYDQDYLKEAYGCFEHDYFLIHHSGNRSVNPLKWSGQEVECCEKSLIKHAISHFAVENVKFLFSKVNPNQLHSIEKEKCTNSPVDEAIDTYEKCVQTTYRAPKKDKAQAIITFLHENRNKLSDRDKKKISMYKKRSPLS